MRLKSAIIAILTKNCSLFTEVVERGEIITERNLSHINQAFVHSLFKLQRKGGGRKGGVKKNE